MKTGSSTNKNPAPPVFEVEAPVTTHPPSATDATMAPLAAASGLTRLTSREMGSARTTRARVRPRDAAWV